MEDVVGGDTGPRRWEEYFGELSCKPTTEAKISFNRRQDQQRNI